MISERLENNTITISIHGAFDAETAQEFSFTARRAYRMGFRDFYVSLKPVSMIDKAGLRLLSDIMHKLEQQDCTGCIIHSPSSLQTELHPSRKERGLPPVRRRRSTPPMADSMNLQDFEVLNDAAIVG
ncbi:STAS domain-containing protein [Candidatus Nitrospira salsa]